MHMNKIFRGFTSLCLSLLVLSGTFSAMAASVGSSADDISIGEDTVQGVKTEYSETTDASVGTDVYLTVDNSEAIVSVPTAIILSGVSDSTGNYIGRYSVNASGDISGDESLVVEPTSDTVILNQTGKDSVTASISQQQTLFLADELSQGAETNGSVTATGLTAGSWTGDSVFLIRMTSRYDYYSSLELAATDANNLTTENADVQKEDVEHAVCGLFVSDGKAYIRMFNGEADISNVTFDVPVELNLDNNTLTFAEGQYLTYKDDFTAYNGTFISQNANYAIFGDKTNTESNLSLSRIDFESTITSAIKSSSFIIDSSSKNKKIIDCNFNQNGTGSSSYSTNCIIFRNEDSVGEIKNCNVDVSLSDTKQTKVTQLQGTNSISNVTANVETNNCPLTLAVYNKQDLVINNSNVKVTLSGTTTGSAQAVASSPDTSDGYLTINGGNYYGEVMKNMDGAGIIVFDGDLTINSTDENPVVVYGKQWGLQTSPTGMNEINGGIYTSTNHTAYICGNADIYDAEFYHSNRDKYEPQYLDTAFGFYCGSLSQAEGCTVNLYNCKFGKPDARSGITAKRNNGYISPENINIYDCDIYGGLSYNYTFANHFGNTKFNLYGDTRIWKNANTEWSKEEIADAIANWKSTPSYNSTTQKYNTSYLGKYMINGYVGKVDADTGEVLAVYLTDDANVYDYR